MLRNRLILGLYRVLTIAVSPLLILYVIRRGLRDGRYWQSARERFGLLPASFQRTVPDSVWLHAVSVGEVLSSIELIQKLRVAMPGAPVFLSCSTLAGRDAAESRLREMTAGIFYAPFDVTFAVRRVIRRIRPAVLIVLETEIWPNLYREMRFSNAALVVINGRISDKAQASYRRLAWFFRAVLSLPDAILVQSEQDRERYVEAGAPPDVVRVAGNLKYDFNPASAQPPEAISNWLAAGSTPLWVAASTVAPEFEGDVDEDDAVLASWGQLKNVRLLVAPRKPERFDAVARKLEGAGIPFARRSTLPAGGDAPVLLLDSVGELASVFPHATVVFMGGTLAHRGGHNILEPALFGRPIVAGPHLENFAAIQDRFRTGQGFLEIASAGELSSAVQRLLGDEEARRNLGARAKSLAEAERGATDRAVAAIAAARANAVPRRIPPLALRLLAGLWTAGGRLKRAVTRTKRLSTPVVSIGNLAMGGTGKTPVVRALARALKERGLQPAVLTRGYGRESKEAVTLLRAGATAPVERTGDEAQTILRDGCAHVAIGADRYRAGLAAEKAWHPDVFLLDDGFQHARLARDLDVVLLNPLDPYAGGWTFPAGRLREPREALSRADLIVFSQTKPICWVHSGSGKRLPPDAFAGRKVYGFCGLANPEAFRRTLESLGCDVAGFRAFPDHHRYTPWDLRDAAPEGAVLVTTEKDAVKLRPGEFPAVWWLSIEAEIDIIMKHIDATLRLGIPR